MRTIDLFDEYLDGTLSVDAAMAFEQDLESNSVLAKAFLEHKTLLNVLRQQHIKNTLKQNLQSIHQQEFGDGKVILLPKKQNLLKKYYKTMLVACAASFVGVVCTISVLSSSGYLLKKQSNEITDLKRDVMVLKSSKDVILKEIAKTKVQKAYAPANLEGSAFALNSKGFLLTSLHMVQGADSIFIQNSGCNRALAKLIYSDARLDLAVLKVTDSTLTENWKLPYSFLSKGSDVGEKVFTLGYPREDVVYGEGSLSSLSGYYNDTAMYQVSIPVNPGNSGGPLMDESGHVIGVIRGKITNAEGTGFAIKTSHILQSIRQNAPEIIIGGEKKSTLKNLKRPEQVKKMNPYVFNILVYNN
jgi:serine protease Do